MERDFQAELKAAQVSVKTLGAKRDKLIGDQRAEEVRVAQAVEQLKALGIDDAANLTVEGLEKLRKESEVALATNLDALKSEITAAEAVVREYEAATV